MALGRQGERQADLMIGWAELPRSPGHAFYDRLQAILVTSNLPFDEWTSVFGAERLTGALLDRLTHHVHILEMNGESYRLQASRRRRSGLPAEATTGDTPV